MFKELVKRKGIFLIKWVDNINTFDFLFGVKGFGKVIINRLKDTFYIT
jgi:hypothetical protein